MSVTWESGATTQVVPQNAWQATKGYRLHILILKEDDGTFSAVALNLAGAGSCGDTEVEAMENAKEAVLAVIDEYQTSGGTIPWKDTSSEEIPAGAKQKWIILNA